MDSDLIEEVQNIANVSDEHEFPAADKQDDVCAKLHRDEKSRN